MKFEIEIREIQDTETAENPHSSKLCATIIEVEANGWHWPPFMQLIKGKRFATGSGLVAHGERVLFKKGFYDDLAYALFKAVSPQDAKDSL